MHDHQSQGYLGRAEGSRNAAPGNRAITAITIWRFAGRVRYAENHGPGPDIQSARDSSFITKPIPGAYHGPD